MHASLTKQQVHAAPTQSVHTTPHTTITTSTHNPPIMASSPSASDWECGACTSFNKGGKYCPMWATLYQKRQALFAVLTADIAAHAAVVVVPTAVAKVIPSAPMSGAVVGASMSIVALPAALEKMARTVIGAPAPLAKKTKAPVVREVRHQRSVPRRW
jgi:hypothetical protein